MSNPDYFNDVILLMPFNNVSGLLDVKGHQINPNGSLVLSPTDGKFNPGNLQLNGSQYLQVASSTDLNLQLQDFTVEVFFYPTAVQTACLYSSEITYVNNGAAFYMVASSGAMYLQYYIEDTGALGDHHVLLSGTTDIALNSWHTAAISRANGVLNLFLDGNLEATSSPSDLGGSIDFSGGSYIGKDFVGKLNDFRLSKNFGYAANYVPPTISFPILVAGIDFIAAQNSESQSNIKGIDPLFAPLIDLNVFSLAAIDLVASSNVVNSHILTIATLEHLVTEGIQVIPYSVGAYCLFSFDITKMGTLVADKGWIDENNCLWIKPDGVTIGSLASTADIPINNLQLLFNRMYHNDNCELYDTSGQTVAKTNPASDWANNYKLAVFGNIVATPGVETLICAGILLDRLT